MQLPKNWLLHLAMAACLLGHAKNASSQSHTIEVDTKTHLHPISRLLTGAGIEDVNHEIYGGIYSQMVFGESFQEPSLNAPIEGFEAHGGTWTLNNNTLHVTSGAGNKLIAKNQTIVDGKVEVDVRFNNRQDGNAGLILRVSDPREGADAFFGYEVSLYPAGNFLRLGKHRNNWELIQDVPCPVPVNQWIRLTVELKQNRLTASVDGKQLLEFVDDDPKQLESGTIGLRQWQREAEFRNLKTVVNGEETSHVLKHPDGYRHKEISRMWDPVASPGTTAEYLFQKTSPFVGTQSQIVRFVDGQGSVGLVNRSLNRWGMFFKENSLYEGVIVARATNPCSMHITAESIDGTIQSADAQIDVASSQWKEYPFTFTTSQQIDHGQFKLALHEPGEIEIGYVFLQPGAWGRFKDLPLRRDIVELMQKQGITILRYGGSMINNDQYRWKNMIGPRSKRPPYRGFWYPYSTNGWGIIDFMNLCEAAEFEYVPTFGMHESPEDMQDFIRYAKEPATSPWGSKRAADGRQEPYQLKMVQLGNEERVDESFAERFNERAAAIWAIDPTIRLVVGDFVYEDLISDPNQFTGALSKITNLRGHQKILEFAKKHNQEIWFDIHIWTSGPRPTRTLEAMFTYRDAIKKVAGDAKFKVLTFEFNSNNHDLKRALANAIAINAIERAGDIPIATSANGLQPDGQNDNGWDQGLLFLTPSQVWLQPPGYVTQMFSNSHRDYAVPFSLSPPSNDIDCSAKVSEDGKSLALTLVNLEEQPKDISVRWTSEEAYQKGIFTEIAGELHDANSAEQPNKIVPKTNVLPVANGAISITLQPRSISSLELSK